MATRGEDGGFFNDAVISSDSATEHNGQVAHLFVVPHTQCATSLTGLRGLAAGVSSG